MTVPDRIRSLSRRPWAVTGGRTISYAALAAALLAPGLWLGPTVDAAAFVLVGSGIRAGAMPYRDYWDYKPPGLYLLNAATQAGLPWLDPWLVCWLLTLLATIVAAIVLESLLRPRVGTVTAWLAALGSTFFVASYPLALGGGYGESLALPFVLGALWLVSRWQGRTRDALAVGLLLGAAGLLSLQAAPAAFAIGLGAAFGGTVRGTAARLIALALGGLALPLLAIGWLFWVGIAAQAYDVLIGYNLVYGKSGQGLIWLRLAIAVVLLSALLPSVAAQFAAWLRRIDPIDRLGAVCVVWLVVSVASYVVAQRIYMHYVILLVPALVVVGAGAFRQLAGRLRDPGAARRRLAIAAQGWFAAMLVVSLVWGAEWSVAVMPPDLHADSTAVSAWLRSNTPASATLFVWGNNPEIYLNSGRAPASPYIYMDPLITPGYWSPADTDRLLARFTAEPPSVFVETPAVVPMFRPAATSADDPRTYDVLGELRTFVRDNYHLADTEGHDDVWLRNPCPQGPGAPGLKAGEAVRPAPSC
jgi:hypothetical protein